MRPKGKKLCEYRWQSERKTEYNEAGEVHVCKKQGLGHRTQHVCNCSARKNS